MAHLQLARFSELVDANGIHSWAIPGATALIDLVPPALDAEPDVNYAVVLSELPLDSSNSLYYLGEGDATDVLLTGDGQDNWERITGYRPEQTDIANVLAQHLLSGSDPTGNNSVKPLTSSTGRMLEVHLGRLIWSSPLHDFADPVFRQVLTVELESLAEIYRTLGEQQYRMCLGGFRKKHASGPVKDLIQYRYPAGRDDLPLLDELTPQSVITELWPNTGVITSGQTQSWTVASGSPSVSPAGTITGTADCLLGYTFGGSDRISTWVQGSTATSAAGGVFARSDGLVSNTYLSTNSATAMQKYKRISGSYTQLGGTLGSVASGNAVYFSVIGSTLVTKVAGIQLDSATDTSITVGLRSGVRLFDGGGGASLVAPLVYDDTLSTAIILGAYQTTAFHPGISPANAGHRFRETGRQGTSANPVFRRTMVTNGTRTGSRQVQQ